MDKMKTNEKQISIIIPCFNEEHSIPFFIEKINKISNFFLKEEGIEMELIFIDDGSIDSTLKIIKEYSKKDFRVKWISFSRNFGKEAAIYAGLKMSKGEYVAIMDVDLQDPPELLPQMYKELQEYDIVATRRANRKGEPPIRSFFAHCFYKIINIISDVDIVDGARDFRIMKRHVVNAIISLGEYNRFSKGIFGWVGFKTKWLAYENIERIAGKTKWSFWKLFKYSLQGIVAFSTMPLVVSALLGFLMCIISIIWIIYIFIFTILYGNPVSGYPSLACIIVFLGGIQLLCLGVLGQYVAKIYLETKKRPIYIIKDTNLNY